MRPSFQAAIDTSLSRNDIESKLEEDFFPDRAMAIKICNRKCSFNNLSFMEGAVEAIKKLMDTEGSLSLQPP